MNAAPEPVLAGTPAADGYRMPAEWQPHEATWMIWPQRPDNWRDGAVPAQRTFAQIAATIAAFEPVRMLVATGQLPAARRALPATVELCECETDDAWCRDTGPTFLTNGAGDVRAVHWQFNAWGGLYRPCDRDARVGAVIADQTHVARYRAPFVLEGGSIHVDGEGTVLVTEQCLLNPNRNPLLDRAAIECRLRDYLGVSTVLWLGQGVYNDETDGHVDNLACFVAPGCVAVAACTDPRDPQFAVSEDAMSRLAGMTDARGRSLRVLELPMPGPLFMTASEAAGIEPPSSGRSVRRAGERLAGSYVNYYVGNGFVLMPQLDPRTDEQAQQVLRDAYPGREVIGIATREVLLGGGNIHCITQQQPAALNAR